MTLVEGDSGQTSRLLATAQDEVATGIDALFDRLLAVPADPRARLYEAHAPGLRRYLRVLGATADLDDLLQATFVVLLEQPFCERSDAATAGFLRSTARNTPMKSDGPTFVP